MPDEFQQPHDQSSRLPRRRGDADKDATLVPPADASNAPEGANAASLGQFSLLADPTTISGKSEASQGESNHDEIERLRAALYARSREIVALQRGHTAQGDSALLESSVADSEPQRTDGSLLNSAQARQLADDAHAREKAIRAEVSNARDALRSESTDPSSPTPSSEGTSRQWRTRALVGGPTRSDRHLIERQADPLPLESVETVLRAEMRELRATLSIARDTTRSQKKEIAELRARFSEKNQLLEDAGQDDRRLEPGTADPSSVSTDGTLRHALEVSQSELIRLRDRLRLNLREIETRDAERALLRQTLEERENDLAARRSQLDELQDRFDVQARALDHARLQFDQERNRNTASQELLSRLRETLDDGCAEQPSSPLEAATRRQSVADSTIEVSHPRTPSEPSSQFLSEHAPQSTVRLETPLADAFDATQVEKGFSRPAIFDTWQDDQIRRIFGPMGIDTFIDLLRAPLARRTDQDRAEMPLVVLGRGAWRWAAMLADGLVQYGMPPFTIYVCDPAGGANSVGDRFGHERPIREFLRELRFPDTPESLQGSLEKIEPAALISRDFLSSQSDVEPWLDVLSSASTGGTCLLFSECTGVGPATPPPEISSIGDRIWELMPERYTRVANAPARYASWSEAFSWSQRESELAPANNLLTRLRNRFRLEMLAKFGFLAESFVATPIGENFDAKAIRDRKFLSQVADVDDRKVEAGIVPALHLVAVVDREAEIEFAADGED